MHRTSDYDYDLPSEQIAQYPAERRDQSRLLVIDRESGKRHHRRFSDLTEYVQSGDVLVVNGDNAIDADLGPVVDHHREHSPEATVPVTRVEPEAARETGVAVVDDGRVRSVVEKPDDPPSRWAMAGLQVFSPRIFDACRLVTPSSRGELELSAAIDLLARAGHRVDAVDLPGWRLNVNTPEDVEAATRRLE